MGSPDRTEYIRKPCPCGEGELYVDFLTPDHPWAPPDAHDWEIGIRCNECATTYNFVRLDKQAVLVRKDNPKTPVGESYGELTLRAVYGPEYKGSN